MRRLALVLLLLIGCKRTDGPEIDKDEPTKKPKKPLSVDKPQRVPEKHRSAHTPCSKADSPAPPTVTYGPKLATPLGAACKSKADCTEKKNGRCASGHCTYDRCYEDSDCDKSVCVCEQDGINGYYCKPGDCAVDSDCGASGYCSPTWSTTCGAFFGVVGYYCHTADDECVDDDECTKGGKGGYCAYDTEKKRWRCGYGHCVG